MARPLPMQKLHFLPFSFPIFLIVAVTFSVFSVVVSLCGSRQKVKKTVRLGRKPAEVSSLRDKAHLMAKMITGKKVQYGGETEKLDDDGDDGAAVWKKTIIRGEKCRPLEFSGRILYDSNGNLLHE